MLAQHWMDNSCGICMNGVKNELENTAVDDEIPEKAWMGGVLALSYT